MAGRGGSTNASAGRPPTPTAVRHAVLMGDRHLRLGAALAVLALIPACSDDTGAPSAASSDTTASTVGKPTSPAWRALADAPIDGRIAAGVVWTGREMIVWGGVERGGSPALASDGAVYDPAADAWRLIASPPTGVLGDVGSAAAWTGDEAVFWAGNSPDGPAAGAAYDPEADTWRELADGPLGPREGYSAVWTGTELLIIGGAGGDQLARPVAAAVDPVENSWRLLSALNDLPGLAPLGAVWTGNDVFMAGSLYLCPELGSVCTDTRPIFLAYDPQIDVAHEIDLAGAPVDGQTGTLAPLAWTGSEVVFTIYGDPAAGLVRYNPSTDMWSTGQMAPCPVDDVYYSQTAWLGDRYVVPCGLDRLQIYDASIDTWETIPAGTSPVNSRARQRARLDGHRPDRMERHRAAIGESNAERRSPTPAGMTALPAGQHGSDGPPRPVSEVPRRRRSRADPGCSTLFNVSPRGFLGPEVGLATVDLPSTGGPC